MPDDPKLTPEALAAHYFPSLAVAPFDSAAEQREAWLRFLDMLCAAMLLYREENGGEAAAFRCGLGQERELAQPPRAARHRLCFIHPGTSTVILVIFMSVIITLIYFMSLPGIY